MRHSTLMAHDHPDDKQTKDAKDKLIDSLLTVGAALGTFVLIHDHATSYKRTIGALGAYLVGSTVHHFVAPDTCVSCNEYHGKYDHLREPEHAPA